MRKRTIAIFVISFLSTLIVLHIVNSAKNSKTRKRMVEYSAASSRESDGAPNLVVMNGEPGYLGYSYVYLTYLEDGYVSIKGSNSDNRFGWIVISNIVLEPGSYTLTGLKGCKANSLQLQLCVWNETKNGYDYYRQYDDDVHFELSQREYVKLQFQVSPYVEDIDILARPAVYKDD